jgi:hypothetical protein
LHNWAAFSNTKLYYFPSATFFGYYQYLTAIHPIQQVFDGQQYYTDRANGHIADIPAIVNWVWNIWSIGNDEFIPFVKLIQWLQSNLNMITHQCRVIANTFTYHNLKNQAIFEIEFSFDDFYGVVGDVFTFGNDSTWLTYHEEINKAYDGATHQDTFYFLPTTCILMEKTIDVTNRKYKCKFMLFQDQYTEV